MSKQTFKNKVDGGGSRPTDEQSEEFDILEEVVAPRTTPHPVGIGKEYVKMGKDLEAKMMTGGKVVNGTSTPAMAASYPSTATTTHMHVNHDKDAKKQAVTPTKQLDGNLAAVGIPIKEEEEEEEVAPATTTKKKGGSQQQPSSVVVREGQSTSQRRRQQQHQQPGAYAVSVGGEPNTGNNNTQSSSSAGGGPPPPDILSQESAISSSSNIINNADTNVTNHDAGGMVPVANPVTEDDNNLPRAHPDLEEGANHHGSGREDDKARKRNLFLAVIVAIIVVLILLFFLMPGKSESNDNAKSSPTQDEEQDVAAPTTSNSSSLDDQEYPVSTKDYLLSLFPSETVASIKNDLTSPQSLAFDWLLNDTIDNEDPLSDYRLRQRFSLATLYYSTSGDGWLKNTYWLNHDIHECDWYFSSDFAMNNMMSQHMERYQDGLFPVAYPPLRCDVKGRYQHLWLSQNKLQGSIPEEVYWMLPSLKTIDLGFNMLEGSISTNIGTLTNLEAFFTFGLQNGREIPSEIGQLTLLKFMGLMQNGHTGQIPSELWRLTNLETLSLNYNPQLTGSIPSVIGTFSHLRHALFHNINITGTIPPEIGQARSIEWLVLIGNSMTGSLPSQVGLLEKMLHVDISSTAIGGTIPTEIGAWKSIRTILLAGNLLEETIPQQIEEFTKLNLTLDLSDNFLSGTIPTSLGLFTSLREISLRNNNFRGPIPLEIGNLPSLEMLSLANNSLTGEVPMQLSEMHQSLYKMELQGNALLTGIIPENLCNVTGTCTENAVNPCETTNVGLSFDCTSLLCGCSCSCEGFS